MKKVLFGFLLLLAFEGRGQNTSFKPVYKTILQKKYGALLLEQCSRGVPKDVVEYFTPTKKEVDTLERHFTEVLLLVSSQCCNGGKSVKSLKDYGYQYAGIIIEGKRFIYVNAFSETVLKHSKNWRTEPVKVCDGGEGFWGVVFDPKAKIFSQLAFNGES